MVNSFRIFQTIIFGSVVDICGLVHDVEAVFPLLHLLTVSGNIF